MGNAGGGPDHAAQDAQQLIDDRPGEDVGECDAGRPVERRSEHDEREIPQPQQWPGVGDDEHQKAGCGQREGEDETIDGRPARQA